MEILHQMWNGQKMELTYQKIQGLVFLILRETRQIWQLPILCEGMKANIDVWQITV